MTARLHRREYEEGGGEVMEDLFPETLPEAAALEEDRRFTLRTTFEWCRERAGVSGFDLDAAAEESSHMAEHYFTVADNGLAQPWHGNVWVNPPFSNIGAWVAKACEEFTAGRAKVIAMLLPSGRQEQRWWTWLVEPFRDRPGTGLTTHYLPGRQSFGYPNNPRGVGVGSPPFGCVLLLWRAAR